jgi:hypothetical protein
VGDPEKREAVFVALLMLFQSPLNSPTYPRYTNTRSRCLPDASATMPNVCKCFKDNHLSFNNRRDYERMLPASEHHKTKAFPRVRHVSIRGMERKAILHNDPHSPSDQRVDAFSALC